MTTDMPRNELEQQLAAAQTGAVEGEAFMDYLLGAQVFLPVREDASGIGNFQRSDRAVPLTIQSDTGQVLVAFSSPERAKPFVQDFPGFDGGLLVEFRWVLERVGLGCGVSLNPGSETGLDLSAEDIDALRADH